ncbi:hypothetical protein [Flavobacterium sp. UBA7680]|uniref:hypothetical protein n=1 Tax=Flavobacterium sp. UBA7680 TaxID=1946559 RepID=UPI0025C0BCE6|nr:hypothetical protein [Flavobacterium sp. UBA7680]
MEKTTKLKKYIESEEIKSLLNDLDFSSSISETKEFLKKIEREEIIALLSDEKKEKFVTILSNIEDSIKNYSANHSNQFCLLINHYISDGYEIFFTENKKFESQFLEIISETEKKLEKLSNDLNEKTNEFNIAKNKLDNAEEVSRRTSKNLEDLVVEAKNRVNTFADKLIKDNNDRIEAKRKQIDNDMITYRKGVEETFNIWVTKFEDLEKSRVEFLKMYEIGIKYSKDARFDEYSLKEQKTANLFRWLSLGLMILVVLVIGYITYVTLKTEEKQNANYTFAIFSMLSRFLLVFSLMIPAVYASRESSRHRRNSDKYAQMANELKAFEIAIRTEDMNQDIRDRIKEEIFKRYFGNIFANNSIDKNISEDLIDFGKTLKPKEKEKK